MKLIDAILTTWTIVGVVVGWGSTLINMFNLFPYNNDVANIEGVIFISSMFSSSYLLWRIYTLKEETKRN